MAAIDRPTLLSDTLEYLGSGNTLTDAQVSATNEIIISQVGDDDANYSEVLCKSLKVCAMRNKSLASITIGTTKSLTVGPIKESYEKDAIIDGWDNFIDSLDVLCPFLPGGGYTGGTKSVYSMYVSPGDTIDVNDTSLVTTDTIL